jgi:hypothetical protein
MAVKRLTGDFARTTVGINPGVDIPGSTQVIGLTDWAMTIKTKSIDASTTDDDAWEDWLPSMSSWTAKAKFVYLMGDQSQMNNIIQATIGTGRRTSSEWNFFLDSESGDDSFSGQAFISGLGISSIIGRTITMDVTLQGRGPLNLRNQASFRASLVLPAGKIIWFESRPLAFGSESVLWSAFTLISTPLPADAIIQGIYPVFIGSSVFVVVGSAFRYGTAVPMTGPPAGVGSFTSPSDPDSTTFSNAEFYGPSIGTSLSALAGQEIGVETVSSLFLGPPLTDEVTITGVGFAVVYTSATPTTDAAMPPPFAVPSGQGLTWALPAAAAFTGDTGAQGTSIATATQADE